MIEQDTIKLLRECDAGVKMGVSSIDDVLGQVRSGALKQYLTECEKKHEKLEDEIQTLLEKYHDDGKEPNPIAKGIAIGTSSHAIGTSKALEMGPIEGAMSSLSIAVAGVLTAILCPMAVNLLP